MSQYGHIYTHLPFCDVICHYCDFYTARSKSARHEEFFTALGQEAQSQFSVLTPSLKTIYFGGGTPSVSPPKLLHAYLDLFRDRILPTTEITLEANPTNITPATVRAWKAAGINRVSIGIQSLRDPLLKSLGRVHSGDEALRAVEICLAEIPNITIDLMYAVPAQYREWPAEDAARLASLGIKHLSAYNLTLEKNHFMAAKVLPGDEALEQIQLLRESVAIHGMQQYEVSNFAKAGFESRHNQSYWSGAPYMALGPSSHGFDGKNRRWVNIADWEKYVSLLGEGKSPIESEENLSQDQRLIEVVFTSLRTRKGLDLELLQSDYSLDLRQDQARFLQELATRDLAKVQDNRLIPSFSGLMLADEIAQKIISKSS